MNRNLRLNPVLDRELRQRSRSSRSPVLITLFLAALIGVLYLAYKGNEVTATSVGDPLAALSGAAGQSMFEWLLTAELVILLVIIPAISAGAIAGERDRQTLIPLQVTLIGPVRIYLGKVLASSSFVLLLVMASAPLLAVPYLAGGVNLSQVLLSLFVLLVIGLLLAAMGVACSAVFRRTQTATLAAYFLMFALTIGPVIGLTTLAIFSPDSVQRGEGRLVPLYPDPFLALGDAGGRNDGRSVVGPLSPIKRAVVDSRTTDQGDVAIGGGVVAAPRPPVPVPVATTAPAIGGDQGGFAPVPSPTVVIDDLPNPKVDPAVPGGSGGLPVPVWLRSLVVEAGIAALLAALAVRRLRAPQMELHS